MKNSRPVFGGTHHKPWQTSVHGRRQGTEATNGYDLRTQPMPSLATTSGAQIDDGRTQTNKTSTATRNLNIFILVNCWSLCCARCSSCLHPYSHTLSPALKRRVHKDDTASEGTTRTNALPFLKKRYESETLTDANHQSACFAVHTKRTVIESNSLAARGQQRRTPNETKTNHKHWWPPSLPQKKDPLTGRRKNTKCAQIISAQEDTFRTWTTKETPRTEKRASHPQLQNRDWMFFMLIALNRTSFDLEM